MGTFFDLSEKLKLQRELWAKHGAATGLSEAEFMKHSDRVIQYIEDYGFDRGRVESAAAEFGKIPKTFVDIIWNDVRGRAETLLSKSGPLAVLTAAVAGMFILLRVLPEPIRDRLITQPLPSWMMSTWFLVLMCIGFLTGLIHFIRSESARRKLKKG
jgi:hypothetical protein